MKIALVTYALQIGGVETFLRRAAQYFEQCGHEVCFLETTEKGRWADSFQGQGFKVVRILPQSLRSRVHHVRRIASFLKDFDLIILNDAPCAQAGLALLPPKTVVIPVLHMYVTTMVRNACSNADNWDALVAVCPAGANSAIHNGVDSKRVFTIPNGVEISDTYPRENSRRTGGTLKIGYVGAINHTQKGVFYLPKIVNLLVTGGVDFTLDIVGTGPDEETLAQRLSPALQQVTLHGALPNQKVMQMLREIDVLLMPSHFEGLPLVLLEAMSLGVVPVVSNLKGCTDFAVTNGKDGFLVEVGDVSGFARVLTLLAGSAESVCDMSIAAWNTACAGFSNAKTGDAYLSLAKRCIQNKQSTGGVVRTGAVDTSILGYFPRAPLFLVRPLRKICRTLRLLPQPITEPTLYIVPGGADEEFS